MKNRFAGPLGLVFLLSLILGATLLTGCSGGKKKVSDAGNTVPALRIGAMSSMDYLPFVVALEQGVYDSLGLKLEIVPFFSANDRDAALMAEQIDGTVTDYTGAMMQHAGGLPVKMVMKLNGLFSMMTAPGKNINSLAELKGKQIAVSNNTVIHYVTSQMLELAGLMPQDIEIVDINKIPLRLEMLSAGQIDATLLPDPFATMGTSLHCVRIADTRGTGKINCTGLIFDEKAIAGKTESIRLLLEGYNRGVDFLRTHDNEAIKDLLNRYVKIPEALVSEVLRPEYEYAALPQTEDLHAAAKWLKERKLLPADYQPENLIDGRFF
ncbi:ABC transporter substrate-binding protein [Porphyromonas macacae]|uniref:ABC transporter substrate-binding protein n=1 Tax=Porphyromonas macacae TaxID=28115 RepID=UPI00068B32F9|nr:ABC transporter substrate-binding protein [Porphyromonas macacae]